jgi:hypothetical protein
MGVKVVRVMGSKEPVSRFSHLQQQQTAAANSSSGGSSDAHACRNML